MVENLDQDLSVERLAWRAAMSRRNFTRVFAAELGTSPAQYVEEIGVEGARHLLEEKGHGVEGVASACGFSSAELMRRAFCGPSGSRPANTANGSAPRRLSNPLAHSQRLLSVTPLLEEW